APPGTFPTSRKRTRSSPSAQQRNADGLTQSACNALARRGQGRKNDPMELTVASYNIHKAVGLDRRRDPERILAVLHELGADVVAWQELASRFAERPSVLPRALIEEHHWHAVALNQRPDSIGWHGNALLVRRG